MKIEKSLHSTPMGEVEVYKLTNMSGANVSFCNFGATILSVVVPDAAGNMSDVALGYEELKSYDKDGPNFGKSVGRVANRIAKGRFMLGRKDY